jgi:hypothetical protein
LRVAIARSSFNEIVVENAAVKRKGYTIAGIALMKGSLLPPGPIRLGANVGVRSNGRKEAILQCVALLYR